MVRRQDANWELSKPISSTFTYLMPAPYLVISFCYLFFQLFLSAQFDFLGPKKSWNTNMIDNFIDISQRNLWDSLERFKKKSCEIAIVKTMLCSWMFRNKWLINHFYWRCGRGGVNARGISNKGEKTVWYFREIIKWREWSRLLWRWMTDAITCSVADVEERVVRRPRASAVTTDTCGESVCLPLFQTPRSSTFPPLSLILGCFRQGRILKEFQTNL